MALLIITVNILFSFLALNHDTINPKRQKEVRKRHALQAGGFALQSENAEIIFSKRRKQGKC